MYLKTIAPTCHYVHIFNIYGTDIHIQPYNNALYLLYFRARVWQKQSNKVLLMRAWQTKKEQTNGVKGEVSYRDATNSKR